MNREYEVPGLRSQPELHSGPNGRRHNSDEFLRPGVEAEGRFSVQVESLNGLGDEELQFGVTQPLRLGRRLG